MVDWNKEISFGRKKKDGDEDAFEEFEAPEAAEDVDQFEPDPVAEAAPAPEPELEPEEKPEKGSLLKKEISLSFKRKPKAPKAAADDEPNQKPAKRRGKRNLRGNSGAKRATDE